MKPIAVFDTECYKGYFLASFLDVETGKIRSFEQREGIELDTLGIKKILKCYTVVGFNCLAYDRLMLSAALKGRLDLKQVSDNIINFRMTPWDFENKYGLTLIKSDMVDLIEVAPGMGSLKVYGARLHSKTLWDLPYPPDASLTPEQMDEVREYCNNDLFTTLDLWNYLQPQIKLREQMSRAYEIDLRSKSDAQIAEAVIKKLLRDKYGLNAKRPEISIDSKFSYKAPDYLKNKLGGLVSDIENLSFSLDKNGSVVTPDFLNNKIIKIGKSEYRMGIGGLHSSESCLEIKNCYSSDVASYYPSLIIKNKYYPPHLGLAFLKIYSSLYHERLDAKHSGDKVKADIIKITLNGTFGKLGSKWSIFYSPEMLIQVTITGQLSLLLLIEQLEGNGISVLSANTDGIVTDKDPTKIIKSWEKETGMVMEIDPVKFLYARDVNSYIMSINNKIKTKGAYALDGLAKNPHADIATHAVIKFLKDGTPISKTIYECTDIRKFLFTRKVEGGALKNNTYLGRVIRWYYKENELTSINYAKNGNKVSESDGGEPLMTLPEKCPTDIDYNKYISLASKILTLIGVKNGLHDK